MNKERWEVLTISIGHFAKQQFNLQVGTKNGYKINENTFVVESGFENKYNDRNILFFETLDKMRQKGTTEYILSRLANNRKRNLEEIRGVVQKRKTGNKVNIGYWRIYMNEEMWN